MVRFLLGFSCTVESTSFDLTVHRENCVSCLHSQLHDEMLSIHPPLIRLPEHETSSPASGLALPSVLLCCRCECQDAG